MSWTTYTVYKFADDLHWPELGILLESIDYHEAARKAMTLHKLSLEWQLMISGNFILMWSVTLTVNVMLFRNFSGGKQWQTVEFNEINSMHTVYFLLLHFEKKRLSNRAHRGLYSLSGKTCYHKISQILEAVRLDVIRRCCRCACQISERLEKFKPPISQLRDYTGSCGKTPARLVNKSSVYSTILMKHKTDTKHNTNADTERAFGVDSTCEGNPRDSVHKWLVCHKSKSPLKQ